MASPTIIQVANELELNQAIATVDGATSGSYIIQFTANITEGTDTGDSITFNGNTLSAPPDLYALNLQSGVSLTISGAAANGGSYTLSGAGKFRGFFAYTGAVTIQNLAIDDTLAKGGAGAGSGGGGAGLGGGLFVGAAAQVTLSGVTFSSDAAKGGDGGGGFASGNGGGLGGDAADPFGLGAGGGGGVGVSATGDAGGQPGIVLGAAPSASTGNYGGGGGPGDGGGVGANGAQGGFGGGGGFGSLNGSGGFGGGGGSNGQQGGNGGFGGGGGGGSSYGGAGGFGAGYGYGSYGGGGLGAGGAIFVQQGGTLTFAGSGGLYGSSVKYGYSGGGGAGKGSAYGSGIFLQGDERITFAPGSGEILTISDAIADQAGSGGTGRGSIIVQGPGTVVLGGDNTFTGGILVEGSGAVLSISADDNLGAASSMLQLQNGTTLELTGSFTLAHSVVFGSATFDVAAGQTVTVSSMLQGPTLEKAGGGTLALDARGNFNTVTIDAGTLDIATPQAVASGTLSFAANARAILQIDGTVMPTNTIAGFSGGDTIVLFGIQATSATLGANDILTVNKSGGGSVQLRLQGNFTGDTFIVGSDGSGSFIRIPSTATVIDVSDEQELNQAIADIDSATSGSYTIDFTSNITEGTDNGDPIFFGDKTLSAPPELYALNLQSGVSVTVNGGGYTLSGAGKYRGIFAYAGSVTIQNLAIDNTLAKGGDGFNGGGGGAGLGGGLFVASGAQVSLSGVTFSGDAAKGGNGTEGIYGPGAGGGLDGGRGILGGGGVGAGAYGGTGAGVAGYGIVLGAANGGGGGRSGSGGGIGAGPLNGGFGGGGGVGPGAATAVHYSGNGGFGGGGAASENPGAGYYGNGGFGGGGAGGHPIGGTGGFGAGNGAGGDYQPGAGGSYGYGGGGLGAGGAIFVQQGGTLSFSSGGLSGSSVQYGKSGGGAAGDGEALGSGIFIQGNDTVTFTPGLGETLTISDDIASQGGSGGAGASSDGGAVRIDGSGTVVLGGDNTYTKGTTVEGEGTVLAISADDNLGALSSTLRLDDGTTLELNGTFTVAHAIKVNGDPTFDVAGGQSAIIGAAIADGATSGDVDKVGAGTLVLDDTDTYSGGTVIEAGILELGNAQAAGSGAITFASHSLGVLRIDGTTMPTNQIDGFGGPHDAILLGSIKNVAGSHADMNYTTNVLTVTEGTNSYQLQFDPTQSFAGDFFHLSSVDGGTEITENSAPCYCPGTLIRTPRGEVPVETLAIGGEVVTASGAVRPIKWIGRRSYAGRFVLGRKDILPVCIKAGALGANVPGRDLWISPHHAMYFGDDGGVLIEAKDLVNGISIVQAARVDKIDYVHIELETHDIIIAEGALSETYLDEDNRGMFHNAREYGTLYVEKDVRQPGRYCAPRLEDGYQVEEVRRRIASCAERCARIKVYRRVSQTLSTA
jgi:autotransporter-associated beta strand protein